MNNSKLNISVFDKFFIRTPSFSIDFLFRYNGNWTDRNFVKPLLKSPYFLNAIYLASPVFYKQLVKHYEDGTLFEKTNHKILYTLTKYLIRMCSRPTPFGLFAGVGLGAFNGNSTTFKKVHSESYPVLNTDVIHSLFSSKEFLLENDESISYVFNSTAYYACDNQLRYLEPRLNKGYNNYSLQSIESSDVLDELNRKLTAPFILQNVVDLVIAKGYEEKEARDYVNDLRDNLVIVPVYNPKGPFSGIIPSLNLIEKIVNAKDNWHPVNMRFVNNVQELYETNESIPTNFNLKPLVNACTINTYEEGSMDVQTKESILDSLHVLNYFGREGKNNDYLLFIDTFKKWYGRKEVRLVDCFDAEYGIGYPVFSNISNDAYLDSFGFKNRSDELEPYLISLPEKLLLSKYEGLGSPKEVIEILDVDLYSLPPIEHRFPKMFEGLFEYYSIDGKDYVHPIALGSGTSTSLKSRFYGFDPDIDKYLADLQNEEYATYKGTIKLEVLFNPFGPAGNLVSRMPKCEHYINYLNFQNVEGSKIELDDLYLKIDKDELILFSKKLKKKVRPFLRSALDYKRFNIPLISFIYDHQFKGFHSENYFHIGQVLDQKEYIPRIVYKNVILQKARWRVSQESIRNLINSIDTPVKFGKKALDWARKLGLPKYVQYIDGDNKLLIDTENRNSLKFLIFTVRNTKSIELNEFLFGKETHIVDQQNENYVNEFVFCFRNTYGY